MNFVDVIIFLALVYYIYDGFKRGFLVILMELLVFVISIFVAFLTSGWVGGFLAGWFHFPKSMGPAFGFIFIWFLVQLVLTILKSYLNFIIADHIKIGLNNRIAGVITSFIRGAVFIGLIVLFVIVMPIQSSIKEYVTSSSIGNLLVNKGGYFDSLVKRAFGQSADDMITFLTVNPFKKDYLPGRELEGSQSVSLGYKMTDGKVDTDSELKMMQMLNDSRMEQNLPKLQFDSKLQDLARKYAKNMFAGGYFSHISLDKRDPFMRMTDAGIEYLMAGENLALAPNVELAQNGLMNSPGHRANILEKEFGKVGIGVIDGGVYGKMFVQEFSN